MEQVRRRALQIPPLKNSGTNRCIRASIRLRITRCSSCFRIFLKKAAAVSTAYFTRVFNPVWTNPDGMSGSNAARRIEDRLHAALTPTWSETAWFADYVLPMGFSSERHDLMSQETYAGRWIGFRQPVNRVVRERDGEKFEYTYQSNPGEVWRRRILDRSFVGDRSRLAIYGNSPIFESPYRPGKKLTLDEYYGWMFDRNSVPGLPEKAKSEGVIHCSTCGSSGI